MNSAAALATAVMATLATCTAIAQEPTNHSKDAHFGIGAGFNLAPLTIVGSSYFASSPFGGGSLVVPIDILGAVRLEPEFGFMRISSTTEDASSRREDKATVVRPALGAFFMFPLGMNVGGTLGGRVGPQFVSQSSESTNLTPNLPPQVSRIITTKRSRVNWALGPAFGGEYFFSKHFSLGAEVALDFLIIGNEDRSVDPGPPPPSTDDSGVVVSTSALLYARAFLF